MKKLFCLLLVAVMLTACGSGSSTPLTFEQLEEKYKREDWEKMLESPMKFLNDFNAMSSQPFSKIISDASSFEKEEVEYGDKYKKDVVLFNMPFELRIVDYKKDDFCTTSITYHGDPEDCWAIFEKLFDKIIESEGDPMTIDLDSDEVDEAALRKAFASGFDGKSASAQWSDKQTKSGHSILISYMNFSEGTLTIY